MKRLTLTLAVLFFAASVLKAQSLDSESSDLPKTVFGVKGGINIAQTSSWFYSEQKARVGLNIGVYARIPIWEELFLRTELVYSSQGGKCSYSSSPGVVAGKTTLKFNYLILPLLFEYGSKVTFQAGGQLGILLNATEEGTFLNRKVDEEVKDVMKSTDISLVLGFGFYPAKNFNAGIRYNLGVTDVVDGDEDAGFTDFPSVNNRVAHLYIAYSF